MDACAILFASGGQRMGFCQWLCDFFSELGCNALWDHCGYLIDIGQKSNGETCILLAEQLCPGGRSAGSA
jgi:hypothetical protein